MSTVNLHHHHHDTCTKKKFQTISILQHLLSSASHTSQSIGPCISIWMRLKFALIIDWWGSAWQRDFGSGEGPKGISIISTITKWCYFSRKHSWTSLWAIWISCRNWSSRRNASSRTTRWNKICIFFALIFDLFEFIQYRFWIFWSRNSSLWTQPPILSMISTTTVIIVLRLPGFHRSWGPAIHNAHEIMLSNEAQHWQFWFWYAWPEMHAVLSLPGYKMQVCKKKVIPISSCSSNLTRQARLYLHLQQVLLQDAI